MSFIVERQRVHKMPEIFNLRCLRLKREEQFTFMTKSLILFLRYVVYLIAVPQNKNRNQRTFYLIQYSKMDIL